MNSKKLLICNSDRLFEILHEINENFNFKVIKYNKKIIKFAQSEVCLFISTKKINEINDCLILDDLPKKISFIIEKINLAFIQKIYSNQSEVKIKNYTLNLNSRKIYLKDKFFNLTEKEINLMLFMNSNSRSELNEIQKHVWRHTVDLETHTVETHIYRLRKKFLDNFDDKDIIKHDNHGYYLD